MVTFAFKSLLATEPIVVGTTTLQTNSKCLQTTILEIIYTTLLGRKTRFKLTKQHNFGIFFAELATFIKVNKTLGTYHHTEKRFKVHRLTFRAVLHTAYREHKIQGNPNGFLERIETIPTVKEHLSRQKLITLVNTPCSSDVLKKAYLLPNRAKKEQIKLWHGMFGHLQQTRKRRKPKG